LSLTVVDPNAASWVMNPRDFVIKIIEARAEEGKDVKCPVNPSSHLLPVFQVVVGLATYGLHHRDHTGVLQRA